MALYTVACKVNYDHEVVKCQERVNIFFTDQFMKVDKANVGLLSPTEALVGSALPGLIITVFILLHHRVAKSSNSPKTLACTRRGRSGKCGQANLPSL